MELIVYNQKEISLGKNLSAKLIPNACKERNFLLTDVNTRDFQLVTGKKNTKGYIFNQDLLQDFRFPLLFMF